MATAPKSTLRKHRDRLARGGMVRLEVNVRKDDAPLVRSVVSALNDPDRGNETRNVLKEKFRPAGSYLKALLASAPVEGIDLSRDKGTDRDVDL